MGERPVGPVRQVATGRKTRSIAHDLPVARLGRRIPYESRLESDLVMVLAADAAIEEIWAQPETFRWKTADGSRRYTPDYLTEGGGGPVYHEVKPTRRLGQDPTFAGRLDDIRALCAARGARFEIWTEATIRREPRFSNARAIHFAPGPARDPDVAAALRGVLSKLHGAIAVGRLLRDARLAPGNLGDLLALVAVGNVEVVDIDRMIGPETLVRKVRR